MEVDIAQKDRLEQAFDLWAQGREGSPELTPSRLRKERAMFDRGNPYLNDRPVAVKLVAEWLQTGRYTQSWLKSHPIKPVRKANAMLKRYIAAKLAEDGPTTETSPKAHPNASRHIRRKVSHDVRKGTKQIAAGKTVRLDDADLVQLHGRAALHVLSPERYKAAVGKLNDAGARLDLKVKDGFRQTLDALSGLFERRAA